MNAPLPNASPSANRMDTAEQRKSASVETAQDDKGGFKKAVKDVRDAREGSRETRSPDAQSKEQTSTRQNDAKSGEADAPAGESQETDQGSDAVRIENSKDGLNKQADGSVEADIAKLLQGVVQHAGAKEVSQTAQAINAAQTTASMSPSGELLASAKSVVNAAENAPAKAPTTMAQVLSSLTPQMVQGKAAGQPQAGQTQAGQTSGLKTAIANGNVVTPQASGFGDALSKANVQLETSKAVEAALNRQNTPELNGIKTFNGPQQPLGGEVKVLSVETYLPPASETGRPTVQVANALSKSLQSSQAAPQHPQDATMQTPQSQVTKPMKALQIQLRPDNLGTVTASMQMRGGELEISLMTSTREAAELLRGDRHALVRVLQDAGYRTDTVNVNVNVREDMGEQMRQSGQNSERFAQGGNSEEGGEHDRGQTVEDDNTQDRSLAGAQDLSDTPDLRSGIYL